ncbi:MAG TPA: hypothetical protein PK239_17480 [Chitinophagales bacterium]|nr:hypothetical protein [Chitinophagales bacterium]
MPSFLLLQCFTTKVRIFLQPDKHCQIYPFLCNNTDTNTLQADLLVIFAFSSGNNSIWVVNFGCVFGVI